MLLAAPDAIFTAQTMSNNSFFEELTKRKVLRAAAIYFAVAWAAVEVVVTIVDQLFLPQWVSTLAVILFVMGFPIAMFLSWTFDLTASGLQRATVDSRRGKASLVGGDDPAIRRNSRSVLPDPARPADARATHSRIGNPGQQHRSNAIRQRGPGRQRFLPERRPQ